VASTRPAETSQPTELVEAIRHQTQVRPADDALVFLRDGEEVAATVTYGELDSRLRAIAAGLQPRATAGDRVLLIYPPGIEYVLGFLGCIYAGLVPVPAYVPHPERLDRMLPRLRAVADDAQPKFILSSSLLAPLFEGLDLGEPGRPLRPLFSDELEGTPADTWRSPARTAEDVVFLQYTSGSTGHPKGVVLQHRHVLANIRMFSEAWEITQDTSLVTWLPPYHDMGLIGCILGPLVAGGTTVMMSPESFMRRPIRWLEAISRFGTSITGGPNFAYELCVKKATAADRSRLDLSRWKYAINAAEPVRATTLARFTEAFADCGFAASAMAPTFGLAEATLVVSSSQYRGQRSIVELDSDALADGRVLQAAPGRRSTVAVSCGPPAGDFVIAVADPATCGRCAEDQVGEIWVSGPSVAAGYWQRPAETAETFKAELADEPGRRYLRTGDLGFLHDGALVIVGRLKDLLIIAGRNHHPHDVERTVEGLDPRLRPGCSAAVVVDGPSDQHLVVISEINTGSEADHDRLLAEIRRAINDEHEIVADAVVLVAPRTIPKTSSGKIQRKASGQAFLDQQLQVVREWLSPRMPESMRPQLELEQWLSERVAAVLGIPSAELEPDVGLENYGVGFVEAATIVSDLEAELCRALPETLVRDRPTLRELARFLADADTGGDRREPSVDRGSASPGHRSTREVEEWIREKLADAVDMQPGDIGLDRRFEDYGLDSLAGATLVGDLEAGLGRAIPEKVLVEHRTVRTLARFLREL
jgi:acyl-CoA synthetase (AMP-forming)/AMP-acid ligase II/acyl carrier protein